MDFSLYQAVFIQKDANQNGWVFSHDNVGQSLLCGDKSVQLLQPGALASSFVRLIVGLQGVLELLHVGKAAIVLVVLLLLPLEPMQARQPQATN